MSRRVKDLALVALFPALLAATAWITIPIGIGAPITLQTLFVMLSGLLLGHRRGTYSVVVYVVLGLIGLPIFSGMQGGFGVIMGPTFGFILSFILMAFFIGKMKSVKIINNEKIRIFTILVLSNVIVYMFGGAYMMIYLNLDLASTGAILSVYFLGDFVKILVALYVYVLIRKQITYEGA